MLYFAYGSNTGQAQMDERCPGNTSGGIGVLPGYALVFPRQSSHWGGGVASVAPSAGGRVEGVLYDLALEHLKWLDGYEGVPDRYTRVRVTVARPDGETAEAVSYEAVAETGGPFLPSRAYRDQMVAGAREHGLSSGWIGRLEALDVCD